MNWKFWKKAENEIKPKDLLDDSGKPRFYPLGNGELVSSSDDPVQVNIPPAPKACELTDYQKAARLEYRYFKKMGAIREFYPVVSAAQQAFNAANVHRSGLYCTPISNNPALAASFGGLYSAPMSVSEAAEWMSRQLKSSYKNV